MKRSAVFFAPFVLLLALSSRAASAAPDWGAFRFLMGEWVGQETGKPAAGACSFSLDAAGTVLVRRNASDAPASEGRPASHHEDLMVIYHEPPDGVARAIYWDNEGHVIRYRIEIPDGKAGEEVRFVSEAGPGPRFRLTYRRAEGNTVAGQFEFGAPGKDTFAPYLSWTMRPVGGSPVPPAASPPAAAVAPAAKP